MPRRPLVALLCALVAGSLFGISGAAVGNPGDADLTFGAGGEVTADYGDPLPVTAVGVDVSYENLVAADVGDRFALGRYMPDGRPYEWGGSAGWTGITVGAEAQAHGLVPGSGPLDSGLVVGTAGGDFGLARFEGEGVPARLFGVGGHATVGFGGQAEAWAGVFETDDYGFVVAGSARVGSTSRVAVARIRQDAALVPAFGGDGRVLLDLGPGDDEARSIVRQDDEKYVLAGRSGTGAFVARLTHTGALDPTFGSNGIVRLDLGAGDSVAYSLALTQGGLVVGGRSAKRFFVSRLLADGARDATFGTDGTFTGDFGGVADEVRALRVASGGAVTVAGTTTRAQGADVAVARLMPEGRFDPGFGDGGIVVRDLGGATDVANAVGVRYEDGSVVVAGGDGQRAALVNLTSSGAPDTRSDPTGIRYLNFGASSQDRARATAIAPDGSMVVAGNVGSTVGLLRLAPNGAPDLSFGRGGKVISDLATVDPVAVALAPDGGIVVWGFRRRQTTGAFLARFHPDGRLDTDFGTDGVVDVDAVPGGRGSLIAQPDGKLVTAGSFLARWNPNGTPDTTFGNGGVVESAGGQAVVRQPDGGLVVLSGGSGVLLTRYDNTGRSDPSFSSAVTGLYGSALTPGPDGGFVVMGYVSQQQAAGDIFVAKILPNGQLNRAFGTNGTVVLSSDGAFVPDDVAVQTDGRVLVAATKYAPNVEAVPQGEITRLEPDGQLDRAFGHDGVLVPDSRVWLALDLQASDRLLVTGSRLRPGEVTEGTWNSPSVDLDFTVSRHDVAPPPAAGLPPVAPVNPPVSASGTRSGYWMVDRGGSVYGFGAASRYGNATAGGPATADLEPSPSGRGYWITNTAGTVQGFGDAKHLATLGIGVLRLGEEVTSLSATPSGAGYWLFTTRGRVLPFGDAPFLGDMSAVVLNGPVLDSIPTPSGRGYYMVASDGGIFAFGEARFAGSMGGTHLNAPVQSLVPDSDGAGYWLVASDGGIFAFAAPFRGSMGGRKLNKPVTGMVRYGDGYLMVAEDGGIFNFSSLPFQGSLGSTPPAQPIVSVAALG